MVEIKINLDEKELQFYMQESWYREARKQVKSQIEDLVKKRAQAFINKKLENFDDYVKAALVDVLKTYHIKDLEDIKKHLGIKEKKK